MFPLLSNFLFVSEVCTWFYSLPFNSLTVIAKNTVTRRVVTLSYEKRVSILTSGGF